MDIDHRLFFGNLFNTAVKATDPDRYFSKHLPARPNGRTIVVGAGKASAHMAASFEKYWDAPLTGYVVTGYGHSCKCKHIEVAEAAHPLPDHAGLVASGRIMELVGNLTCDDLVVALVSGGGSALLPSPPDRLTLQDEIEINRALLKSGAPIRVMNTIRKQLSSIKGGRLSIAAYPARVVTYVISDIPGDALEDVASGPTIADDRSRFDALGLIRDYRIDLPEAAIRHLNNPLSAAPAKSDFRLTGNETHLVASASMALEAAASSAESQGIKTCILSDAIQGESRDVAPVLGAITREVAVRNRPFAKPVLLLSGGETSVRIDSTPGKGGRNLEFMLSLAIEVQGIEGVYAFAADTDGIDGVTDSAGAFVDHTTVQRLRFLGLDPSAELARHNSWHAFHTSGDLFTTGPSGTNVNDFRGILVI